MCCTGICSGSGCREEWLQSIRDAELACSLRGVWDNEGPKIGYGCPPCIIVCSQSRENEASCAKNAPQAQEQHIHRSQAPSEGLADAGSLLLLLHALGHTGSLYQERLQ